MIEGELQHERVERFRGDARLDVGGEHVECFGRELAGFAHALEGIGPVQLDLAVAVGRARNFDVRHVRVPERARSRVTSEM